MLLTMDINKIDLDVYYNCLTTTDPLATGDSPTCFEVDLIGVETLYDAVDVTSLLSEDVLMQIEQKIINFESER